MKTDRPVRAQERQDPKFGTTSPASTSAQLGMTVVARCGWPTYGQAMEVVVAKTPEGWLALDGEVAIGKAAAMVRPDARCLVSFDTCRADAHHPLVQAMAQHLRQDLYTEIDEADLLLRDRLVEPRPTPPTPPPTGCSSASAPTGPVVPANSSVHGLQPVPPDEPPGPRLLQPRPAGTSRPPDGPVAFSLSQCRQPNTQYH